MKQSQVSSVYKVDIYLIDNTIKNPAKKTSLSIYKLLHTSPTPTQNFQDFLQIFKYTIVMGKKYTVKLV